MDRNWHNVDAVETPGDKVDGAWVFRGTRVPVAALFENLRDGATIDHTHMKVVEIASSDFSIAHLWPRMRGLIHSPRLLQLDL